MDHIAKICAAFDLATAALVVLLVMTFYILWQIQRDKTNGLDLKEMLKGDNGKLSAMRLGTLIAIPFSSWFLIYYTMHAKEVDVSVLAAYLGVWVVGYIGQKYTEMHSGNYNERYPPTSRWTSPDVSTLPDPPARVDPEDLR